MSNSDASVLAWREGRVGRITLNRPRALNALDITMIRAIAAALDEWRTEPSVHAVIIKGAGDRAFCAGGDIRAVREAALAGRTEDIQAFFAEEYALNLAIASYPKPFVALVDGICMGGGVGVSAHGSTRIVTDAALFAMPETGIGLFPDIGATYILPRLRGQLGMYMALTGARLSGADALYAGLATHFTDSETMAALPAALAADGMAALADITRPAKATLPPHMAAVEHCFGAGSVPDIVQRLEDLGTKWSSQVLATLRTMSPSALCWTFRIVREGASRTLPQCLAAELALTGPVTRHPDLAEGVRAAVIDKDRRPRWSPASLADVDAAAIEAMFTI